MTKSEDATSGTTVAKKKTSSKYEKGHTIISSGRGGRGDRGNARNKTRDFVASTNKYYKG